VGLATQYRIDLAAMQECHARMLRLPAMALLFCAIFPWAAQGHNCRCIYNGGHVAQGGIVCIKTSKGYQRARCEMFLNNSSWKFLEKPCDNLQSQKSTIQPENG
jgi:hypothetical protein